MKNNLYLDTSILSAFYGYHKPVRQLVTQKWFENETKNYKLYSSVIAIEELDRFQNIEKRDKIKDLLNEYNINILQLNNKIIRLSKEYINKGAIPKTEEADALHIAIATVNNIELLASWNFKHIVSINPIRKINEINKKMNYNNIDIGSLELFGGYKYGNL